MNANSDAELLALEAKLVDEYTAMEAKKGKTDDEVNEWTARLDVLERQFAGMSAHTVDGVAAKLRRVNFWIQEGCTGDWGEQLSKTTLAALEQFIEAGGQTEPDAELLRLNAEYRAFLGEINAGRHNDAKGNVSDEARNRMSGLEKKIADTPAESYAGIGIKLLIGVDNFCPLDPGETRTTDELNLESALADAERLAGATSSTVAPETTGEDPFEALAAEWAEQKAECERLAKAENEAGVTGADFPSDAAQERLGEIEKRISVTPTTTILGIATKLRAEASVEVEYEFTTTENVIKTALEAAEQLLAQSRKAS